MKVTLHFDLPEEREEYDDCLNGGRWRAVVEGFYEWLRMELKYKDPPVERALILEEVRDALNERVKDWNLE